MVLAITANKVFIISTQFRNKIEKKTVFFLGLAFNDLYWSYKLYLTFQSTFHECQQPNW